MKKFSEFTKKQKILSGIGTIVSVLTIYFIFEHFMYVTTDNAQVEAHAVMLAFKVPGIVTNVKVIEGQKVAENDVLAEIDDRDYQNAVKIAQGEVASIEAKSKDAERNYRRISELYSSGAVSQAQFDTARASYTEVKAKFDAITAQLSQAQLNLEHTVIRAPSKGFIAKKSLERGQFANAGVPMIGFVGAQERWITANFKETEIEGIKIGAHVSIDVDAISKGYEGRVESISSATGATFTLLPPDNATGNFTKVVQRVPVKIRIEDVSENDIELLRSGLSSYVKIRKH